MRNHIGARVQREALELQSRRSSAAVPWHDQALDRYLRLESGVAGSHLVAADVPRRGTQWGLRKPHGVRAGGPLRHERVVINGRDVELTEDSIGVVELHLC